MNAVRHCYRPTMKGKEQVLFPRIVNQFKGDRSKMWFVIASLLVVTFTILAIGTSVRLIHVAVTFQNEAAGHQVPSKVAAIKNLKYLLSNRSIVDGLAPAPVKKKKSQRPDGGAFVHIGKTGGSALSLLLRNGCHSWIPHPCRNITNESIVSRHTVSYYHVPDFALLPRSHHDFYLVTTRDPFDRWVSAFVNEHIANRRARKVYVKAKYRKIYNDAYICFPTLEVFVSYLEGNSTDFRYPYSENEIHLDSCKDLARAAFHGRVVYFNHFYSGYQRIKNLLPNPEVFIMVTRNEHLWQDWIKINQLLGQETPVHVPRGGIHQVKARNVTHLPSPVTRDLSEKGTVILCRALQDEYDAFFWFLRNSINLGSEDVQEAVERAKQRCGAHWKI